MTYPVEFYVREKDLIALVKHGQFVLDPEEYFSLSIGNCGWANALDCWWVRFEVEEVEHRNEIIDWIVDNQIELYNPALIY